MKVFFSFFLHYLPYCLIFALIVVGIVILVLKSKMNNIHYKNYSGEYIVDGSFDYNGNDQYLYSTETYRIIEDKKDN